MSDYTAAEVLTALAPVVEDDGDGWEALEDALKGREAWTSMRRGFHHPAIPPFKPVLRGEEVEVEVVEDHGGGEGSGEARWIVVRVGDQFFKQEGYYMSHDGSYFDGDFKEVQKVERMVTFYE